MHWWRRCWPTFRKAACNRRRRTCVSRGQSPCRAKHLRRSSNTRHEASSFMVFGILCFGRPWGLSGEREGGHGTAEPEWAATPVRAHAVEEYYRVAQTEYVQALKHRVFSRRGNRTHAGLADTSLTLALDPRQVRMDRLRSGAKPGMPTVYTAIRAAPAPNWDKLGVDAIVTWTGGGDPQACRPPLEWAARVIKSGQLDLGAFMKYFVRASIFNVNVQSRFAGAPCLAAGSSDHPGGRRCRGCRR